MRLDHAMSYLLPKRVYASENRHVGRHGAGCISRRSGGRAHVSGAFWRPHRAGRRLLGKHRDLLHQNKRPAIFRLVPGSPGRPDISSWPDWLT